jgi:cellulose synthase/poly-beta-1,6-N-acetylglucosamine synthase-like glycosyltransferase
VKGDVRPQVSVIVSVFNEERVIEEKIKNTLALEYPVDLLEVLVSSDGSTDTTHDIVSRFDDSRLVLRAFPERSGKTACLNRVVPQARGDIILFTDANSMFSPDLLLKLVRNFADPRVGLVTGWTRYTGPGESGEATGAYARMEKLTKQWESAVSSCVGADGAVFALRRELYEPLEDRDINDLVIPLHAVSKGKRVVLDPEVFCFEEPAQDERKEFRRQVRITNRTLGAIMRNLKVLNPSVYGTFAFFLMSHKVLRFLVPFFFLGALLICLSLWRSSLLHAVLLLPYGILIGLALAGVFGFMEGRAVNLAKVFLITLFAQFLGWGRFLFGKSDTTWTPQR